MKRIPLLMLALWLTVAAMPAAEAAWVWTPETGWVGPSGPVKGTPEEQLAYAMEFFDRKQYDDARRELKKLLKKFKDSREAAEAQYYFARCREEEGDYYAAFKDYRKTLQTYPSTKRFDEILEREYQIANLFLSGTKRKVFGAAALLPARHKAIEIYQAIVEDGPFSEYGQLAQYKLGMAHLQMKDYEEAVSAFEQLISRYPDSPLVDDARFQIAQASLKGTFKAGYDQSPTDLAVRELEGFLKEYPESDLSTDADDRLGELKARRAEHELEVGRFYERRGKPAAARIYYETVVHQFGQTPSAEQAAARLEALSGS
jgi:outer membrane protein assembly factor BamD (BamD/ComL family)